jgi:hypothetical protein
MPQGHAPQNVAKNCCKATTNLVDTRPLTANGMYKRQLAICKGLNGVNKTVNLNA